MKRYASIDFMRGIAILLMIILHTISDLLDVDGLLAKINNIPFINVIALVVLPFLGGLAGLFLLVSAISNMISMQKQLMKGRSPGMLALRQVITGFIIYVFAALSESTIGYWGGIGSLARSLNQPIMVNWDTILTRWGTFEAIHCIAWCVIINGLIHGIISVSGLWKKPKVQMGIYAFLAVGVLAATKFVWVGISNVYPGFPWATTGPFLGKNLTLVYYDVFQPHLIKNTFAEVAKGWFYGLWAAPMQPLFPYLAVSFIGSIIGIALAQPKEAIFKGFTKTVLIVSALMFLIGATFIILMVVKVIPTSFDDAATLYQHISYHRHWFPDNPRLGSYVTEWSWLWQFMAVNGWGLMATMTMIYMVEFRGKGKKFAERTKFVRRFGFTAFTNYNSQYIFPFTNFWVPQIFLGLSAYAKTEWFGVALQISVVLLTYQVIMRVWEKSNYRGSLEWFMGTIGYYVMPVKKPEALKMKKWYEKGDLAVEQAFYNPEWLNVVEETEDYHRSKRDSRIVLIFAIASFIVPLFLPFTVGLLFVTLKTIKKEGKNKKNKAALILSIIGTVLTVAFSVALFIFSPSQFGIYL
ncbi:MAG: hypothetical protein ACTSRE_13150 [Promethearchaeota archaeon]